MSHIELHQPSEYAGEDLCPCCGQGAVTGWHYRICVDGLTCAESCAIYQYGDMCAKCEEA